MQTLGAAEEEWPLQRHQAAGAEHALFDAHEVVANPQQGAALGTSRKRCLLLCVVVVAGGIAIACVVFVIIVVIVKIKFVSAVVVVLLLIVLVVNHAMWMTSPV